MNPRKVNLSDTPRRRVSRMQLSALRFGVVVCAFGLLKAASIYAQPAAPAPEPVKAAEPLNWTAQQDHKNMMEQLGITRLRPGPSGQSGQTNSANYDPA